MPPKVDSFSAQVPPTAAEAAASAEGKADFRSCQAQYWESLHMRFGAAPVQEPSKIEVMPPKVDSFSAQVPPTAAEAAASAEGKADFRSCQAQYWESLHMRFGA